MFDEQQQQQQQHQAYAAYGFVPSPFDYSFLEPAPAAAAPSPASAAVASMPAAGLSAASSVVGRSDLLPPVEDLAFDLDLDLGYGTGAALFAESWRALDPFPTAQHGEQQQQQALSAEPGDHDLAAGASYATSATMSPFIDKTTPAAVDELDGFALWLQSFGTSHAGSSPRWFRPRQSLTPLSHRRPHRHLSPDTEPHGSAPSDLPLILSSSTAPGEAVSPRDIFWADVGSGPSTTSDPAAAHHVAADSAVKRQIERALSVRQSRQTSPAPTGVDLVVALPTQWLTSASSSTHVHSPPAAITAPMVLFSSPEPEDAVSEQPSASSRKVTRKRSAPTTGAELEAAESASAFIAPPTARSGAKKAKTATPASRPNTKAKAASSRRKVSFDESTTGGSDDGEEDDEDENEPAVKGGKGDKSQLSKKERRKASTSRASLRRTVLSGIVD
jgi:hypothetical protein